MVSIRAKKRNNIILMLILCPIMIFGGILLLTEEKVDCGGHTMSADDICQTSVNFFPTGDNTLEEQRSRDHVYGWIALAAGVFFGAAGVRGLIRFRRENATA